MNLEQMKQANLDKAHDLVVQATANNKTIGTAESCTGGLVSGAITAISGSSAPMMGGIVSYACSVKRDVLKVKQATLDSVGAVSSQCAHEMCEGARQVLNCDVAVSITGIAGPTGAVPGKPVGTVWFGITDGTNTTTYLKHFLGDRDLVREQSVSFALDLLLENTK